MILNTRKMDFARNRSEWTQICDLTIDPSAPLAKRAGHMILLTRSEHRLLQFLADNRGKVVSRSMIWENVYEGEGDIKSNLIDVCIHNLRTKIDKGFEVPLILTHWGNGYLLREDV
jgi:DNA-binding response OmpR family regulator